MEKPKETNRNFKKKKIVRDRGKYKCTLCERMVVHTKHIKTRKNYPHGRKSKPVVFKEHRTCGGVLVELKRVRKN